MLNLQYLKTKLRPLYANATSFFVILGVLYLSMLALLEASFDEEKQAHDFLQALANNPQEVESLPFFSVVSGSKPLLRNGHRGAMMRGTIVETDKGPFGLPSQLDYIEPGTPVFETYYKSKRVLCIKGKKAHCAFEITLNQM